MSCASPRQATVLAWLACVWAAAAVAQSADTPPASVDSDSAHIEAPDDAYIALRLADGSVIQVLAEPGAPTRQLRRRTTAGPFDTRTDERRSDRARRVRPFEIQAPGAVASVRG
jgi:hypothetical protein